MKRLLDYCADFIGADKEDIIVQPNLDFVTVRMTADELLKFVQAANQGAPISDASIHALAKQGELTTMSYDDEKAKMEEEAMDKLPRTSFEGDDEEV